MVIPKITSKVTRLFLDPIKQKMTCEQRKCNTPCGGFSVIQNSAQLFLVHCHNVRTSEVSLLNFLWKVHILYMDHILWFWDIWQINDQWCNQTGSPSGFGSTRVCTPFHWIWICRGSSAESCCSTGLIFHGLGKNAGTWALYSYWNPSKPPIMGIWLYYVIFRYSY